MNKDIHQIFEAYTNSKKILNELAPVELSGDYSGSGEDVGVEFPDQSKGKYDLTPEETKQVYANFFSNFRAKGGRSPKLYKDFYIDEISPVVRTVKPSVNATNSKYTSRVLYNALKAAGVLKDERDGISGIKLDKKVSDKGVKKLTKFTLKNAGEFGESEEDGADSGSNGGEGIDDPVMRAFWERIYGEGEFTREELVGMMIDDNEELDEMEAKMNISALIGSGYLEKTSNNSFKAVDPESSEEKEQEEGEGSGEITTGIDADEMEDFSMDSDPWGGVYVGPTRGSGSMD